MNQSSNDHMTEVGNLCDSLKTLQSALQKAQDECGEHLNPLAKIGELSRFADTNELFNAKMCKAQYALFNSTSYQISGGTGSMTGEDGGRERGTAYKWQNEIPPELRERTQEWKKYVAMLPQLSNVARELDESLQKMEAVRVQGQKLRGQYQRERKVAGGLRERADRLWEDYERSVEDFEEVVSVARSLDQGGSRRVGSSVTLSFLEAYWN